MCAVDMITNDCTDYIRHKPIPEFEHIILKMILNFFVDLIRYRVLLHNNSSGRSVRGVELFCDICWKMLGTNPGKHETTDIVGLDKQSKKAVLGECKYIGRWNRRSIVWRTWSVCTICIAFRMDNGRFNLPVGHVW